MADINLDEKKLNTNQNELKDYEIEVADKKGFLSNFFSKFFRTNNNQKLLNTADLPKAQTTTRSINSMWSFGSFRENFFKALDNARKSLSETFTPKKDEPTWKAQVVKGTAAEPTQTNDIKSTEFQAEATHTVPTKATSKGIINNSKTAEDVRLETLDTSGIKNHLDKDYKESEDVEKADNSDAIVATINIGNAQTIEAQDNNGHEERE